MLEKEIKMGEIPTFPGQKKNPWIVCAACRKDGLIICGARHFDSIMRANIKALNLSFGDWEQGFIDQFGNFLNRKEAWEIAKKNGQVKEESENKVLFSENLY